MNTQIIALSIRPAGRARRVHTRIAARLAVGWAVVVVAGAYGTSAANAAIFWANVSSNTIGEANLNGTDVNQSFITGADGPGDVVVNGQYIFWANATGGCTESGSCNGTIGRAKLDGTDINEKFIPADTPYGLTVDGRYIYWSNSGTNTIGRANLDGTGVNQDFITGAHTPDGVVVDGRNIYWSNDGSNTIGEANLNGSDPDQSFITGATAPEGMAINEQYIYWANHYADSIARANLDGSGVEEDFITGAKTYPTRVAVDSEHIYWTTWQVDGVPTTGTIGEANLDGTDVHNNLIYSPNTPVGVAVNASKISVPRSVGTLRITGPTRNGLNRYFDETVLGRASGSANYVITGEQLSPVGGCARTYKAEAGRSDWYQWPTGTGAVRGKFSKVARFYSRNRGTHGVCSYLIDSATRQTIARASRFWTNS